MKLRHLLGILAVSVVVAGSPLAAQGAAQTRQQGAPKMSKGMAAAQGAWVFTHIDGQDVTSAPQQIVVTITGDKYEQSVDGQVVEKGTFKLDETKTPWTIDIIIAEGQDAGKTQLGVVQLTGTTMVGKISDPGATTRPTDFAPADGAFVFTAVKKK